MHGNDVKLQIFDCRAPNQLQEPPPPPNPPLPPPSEPPRDDGSSKINMCIQFILGYRRCGGEAKACPGVRWGEPKAGDPQAAALGVP